MPKTFFIDTSRCTACRGCQIACKEWNELPANKTKQRGSHQNPPDLNPYNYKLVRFSENFRNGVVNWYFFPDQCRHCIEPPCKSAAESLGCKAITRDEATGAVIFNPKVKVKPSDFKTIRESCPYDIPRYNVKLGVMAKCTMCIERIKGGMLPACVKTCPTGAMNFGDRNAMLELANKRLAEVKKQYKDAMLANPDDVCVIFLLADDPAKYHKFAVAQWSGGGLNRKDFLARIFAPFRKAVQRTTQV